MSELDELPFEQRVQRKAEEHLAACNEALYDEALDTSSPAFGPYDGCDTCVVREILSVAWDDMLAEARAQARAELESDDDWYVPGGPLMSSGERMRIIPPTDWRKVEIELHRVPPSKNTNAIRSHWTGYQEAKKSWQHEIEVLLMAQGNEGLIKGYQVAMVGGFLRFPVANKRRDAGNFTDVLDKACGDALVNYGAIPDDDPGHYFFGGVEIEPEPGPPRTRLWIYLQPPEDH
jgi:hypothetical protein